MLLQRVIIFIFLLYSILTCGCQSNRAEQPRAVRGIIDLTRWDFAHDGPVELSGEWEFYWKRLLVSNDFTRIPSQVPDCFIPVPLPWSKWKIDNKKIPVDGYATYRLRARINKSDARFAIRFPDLNTASAAYVDGILIYTSGTVGKTKTESIPKWLPGIMELNVIGNDIEIIIQVSNFHYIGSGMQFPLYLGPAEAMERIRNNTLYIDLFIFGSILIMGLYHIGLFILRRKERAPLFFGLFCISIAVRTFSSGEHFINYLFTGVPWSFSQMLEYLTFALAIPLFVFFIHSLYPQKFNRHALKASGIIGFGISLLIIILPSKIYSHTVIPFQTFTVLIMGYSIITLIRAWRSGLEGSGVFLAGFSLLTLSGINDILYENMLVPTGYYIQFGLFIFIFAQAFILSMRFSNAFLANEKLSSDLEQANLDLSDLNKNLEAKVDERTHVLEETMKIVSVMNDELASSRDRLWGEMKLTEMIQTLLLPKHPSIPGYELAVHISPAEEVAGDYYDIINAGGFHWLVIGDVSGHGVTSGLIMMMTQTAIHTVLAGNPGIGPDKLLEQVNSAVSENLQNMDDGRYVTITVMVCDDRGNFTYSGLHIDPLVYRAGEKKVEPLPTRGFWLGLSDSDHPGLHNDAFILNPGDVLLLYTDGIIEAWRKGSVRGKRQPAWEMFGMDRLIGCLKEYGDRTPEDIRSGIIGALADYECTDDMAMIILKRP